MEKRPGIVKHLYLRLKLWRKGTASSIEHQAIMKDVSDDIEISGNYLLMLTLANLIALAGLITNSAPVIIGAMLISPLMAPFLSFGFSFITGEKKLWRKSVKKIAISVLLTIIISAAASYLSPLKEITQEIISRTRPNLYDLIIASLAGIAGAIALCTKKSFLTIVPGVAIATAVIPPLSVAGFGIGTLNLNIFLGGFFLFFTNFVAIIIATCVVFFIYGFGPKLVTEMDRSQMQKRFAFLGIVMIIISIPLIYTLQQSIVEVKLRSTIQSALKKHLDQKKRSHLSSFSYLVDRDRTIEITAVVNAVDYLKETEMAGIEQKVAASIGRDIRLNLEQIKVQPGGLKEEIVKQPTPVIAPPQPPAEVIRTSRESTVGIIRRSSEKIEKIIAPSTIADFHVGFHDKTFTVTLVMKIKRDTPISDDERLWIERMISSDLNLPVNLRIETIPFVPEIVFEKNQTILSEDMKRTILTAKDVIVGYPGCTVKVESYPEKGIGPSRRKILAAERLKAVEGILIKECGLKPEQLEKAVRKETRKEPVVKISIYPQTTSSK